MKNRIFRLSKYPIRVRPSSHGIGKESKVFNEFLDWYDGQKQPFNHKLIRNSAHEVTIAGVNPFIRLRGFSWEFEVFISYDGVYEQLYFAVNSPTYQKEKAGFVSELLKEEYQVAYPTEKELRIADVYQPIADFINNQLPTLKWVSLSETGAIFGQEKQEFDGCKGYLPIWIDESN